MDYFNRPAVTSLERKIKELVTGHNTNAGNIADSLASDISAGNIGEHVTALGSTISDSQAISENKIIHRILGADDAVGVALNNGVVGQVHILININGTANSVNIYPTLDEKIDGEEAGSPFSLPANRMVIMIYENAEDGWSNATIIVA